MPFHGFQVADVTAEPLPVIEQLLGFKSIGPNEDQVVPKAATGGQLSWTIG